MKRCIYRLLCLSIIFILITQTTSFAVETPFVKCTDIEIWLQEFLDDNNIPVDYLIPNENFNISLGVGTQGQVPCSAKFIAALYNSQNVLQDLKIVDQMFYTQNTLNWIKLTFAMPNDTRGLYVKVYCYDSFDSLKPLIEPIKFQRISTTPVEVIPRVVQGINDWTLKLTLINNTNQIININHPSSQKYDFVLFDINSNKIYQWSLGLGFLDVITYTTIKPGEKVEFSETLSKAEYQEIFDKAMYMKAYITGSSNDFTIDPNGYLIMVDTPRPMKPNIYLYPEKEQNISVKVEPSGYMTKSIPYYGDGWCYNVTPDGKIDGKYDFLFYEAVLNSTFALDKGWVLDKNNFESSMENILTRIGLTEKEKQDFLDYWTTALEWPKQYYAAYLVSTDEINSAIPLTITPKPDCLLRTFFYFVPTDNKINLEEPVITPFVRTGFSAVEWGGMKKTD